MPVKLFLLFFMVVFQRKNLVEGQPVAGECEMAPYWTVNGGKNIMNENRGNVTLVALMELHCSFCRSQIEGFIALSKMLRNQSVNEVQFVIVAPWNESSQNVEYYRRYMESTGIRVIQETTQEPIWPTLKGNKDDFFVYDACGRLSYYIPYPQSYLYYHYTVSTLYSTLRQEKCGACRFIAALKVRAYINVMANTTTHYHYLEHIVPPSGPDQTVAPGTAPGPGTAPAAAPVAPKLTTTVKPKESIRKRIKDRRKNKKTTTTTSTLATTTAGMEESDEFDSVGIEVTETTKPAAMPTPILVSEVSGEETEEESQKKVAPDAAAAPDGPRDEEVMEKKSTTTPSSDGLDEGTAQIPLTTVGTSATGSDDTTLAEDEYDDTEYEEPVDADRHLNGGGAVGAVGASVIGVRKKIIRKRLNGTTSTAEPTTTTTTLPTTTTTMKPITTSWSIDPNRVTTESNGFGRRGWGTTRVPKLPDDVDCTPYTASMCYRQWQEFGTLHSCCQRGVYLTDMCKQPLCNNATFHLCCFQKYQQARFQCCYDTDLSSQYPDDFSRCCYRHFVFNDDGNGDNDDQCCPKSIASYFWTTQTRVAELCLPNVELDLEGIVLEARMSDKSLVKIPLQESTALQYECPYVDKRQDFFYWEPDGESSGDGSRFPKSTTVTVELVDVPE